MRIRNNFWLPSGLCFTGEGGGADGEGDGGQQNSSGGSGYTPPASQADLDRIIQERISRERAKFADYDQVKAEAEQLRALAQTEQDKAAAKAREEALAEANGKAVPRVVRAEFKAAAKGVLDKEQLDALLEDVDLTKYAGSDGEPDEEKIARKIAAFAPKKDDQQQQRPRDLGQGQRPGVNQTARELGAAEAARRFKKS